MNEEQAVNEFAADYERLGNAPIGENDKELLRKFAEYLKDSGLLADCFYE